jgi:putative ABC transport system permease protein
MFVNYFKIAYRNLLKHKGYSAINIVGLSLGLIVSLVIAFYVIDDLTFDSFHRDADRIYRVLTLENSGGSEMTYSITAGPIIPASVENIPEVESGVRAFGMGRPLVAAGSVPIQEMNQTNAIQLRGFITEPEFFDVFSFKILSGDRENALKTPNGILLTPEAAELLFPGEDPIGKRLTIQFMGPGNGNGQQDPYVIGLVEKPPVNSHIQYDFIIPLQLDNNPLWWKSWENFMLQGYVKLNDPANEKIVETKLNDLAHANNMPEINTPMLQPLLDVHMGSAEHRYDGTNNGKNDATVVYALAIIGLMVILIAAINFINLSSARASQRAREVGLRKVVGSNKSLLIFQFLGESIFITLVAMVISILVIQFTVPMLSDFLGKQLNIDFFDNPKLLMYMGLVALFVGGAAGLYPAFILSSFRPVTVLKGEFRRGRTGVLIRRVLVVCQFAITIALVVMVLVIQDQIKYLQGLDMGYNREQVIAMFAPNNADDLLLERTKNLPGVISVGRSSGVLGGDFIRYEIIPEGKDREESSMFQQITIDDGFFNTLEIKMGQGRNFSRDFISDTSEAIIINETAAKKAGWKDPIGKRLSMIEIDGSLTTKRVVGVVKDFHFANTRQGMEPLFFQLNTQGTFLFVVRLAAGRINETIDEISALYSDVYPGRNFNFQFLDDVFDRQFNADRDFATNVAYFSGFAILIACLGLLGLVAYAVDQKKSEIAVRKVLGSGEATIVKLLAFDFLKWVLLANLIAWPLAYYAVNKWLEGFVYRVSLDPVPFIISGLGALTVAFLTMLYQTIKAARTNPARALRSE